MDIEDEQVDIGHEATVSKVGDEQLFYLMSRGLSELEATNMGTHEGPRMGCSAVPFSKVTS